MLFNYRENIVTSKNSGKRRGVSSVEYAAMVLLIIAGMVVMQKYVLRSMAGHWKSVGDSFGFGRQYDPAKTKECMYDMTVNKWIGVGCFDSCIKACDSSFGVGANLVCETACHTNPGCIGFCPQ